MELTKTLNIEAGKYYRTRGGRKAFVAAVSLPDPSSGVRATHPVHGLIGGFSRNWTLDGHYRDSHGDDLVAEWKEPRTCSAVMTLCRDSTGALRIFHGNIGERPPFWVRWTPLSQETFTMTEPVA